MDHSSNASTSNYKLVSQESPKHKPASYDPSMEPPTERAITIKEELACDSESNPQIDMNVKVKQEFQDESLEKIDYCVSSIPEAIVKDELIINDALEPVESEQKVCDPESNPKMAMNVKVKKELEDKSLDKIDYGGSLIPEAIVKDELIINDTEELVESEQKACDPESNPLMDMNVKVKQELEDDSSDKNDYGGSSIPEAIVKDELIINDTLEPMEWEEKACDPESNPQLDINIQGDDLLEPVAWEQVPVEKKCPKSGSKTNGKNFRCKVCSKRFTKKETANKHARDVHNVDQGAISCGRMCPFCEYSSLKNKEYIAHLAKHKDKDSGKWRCILCSKLYKDRVQLKKHTRGAACQKSIERKEKQLKMSTDNKNLAENTKNSSTSVTSMVTPSVIPTCAECNQKFSNRSMYDEHIKYEHEPNGIADRTKRHSCDICGLLLMRKYNHQKHMEFHKKRHSSILTIPEPESMTQDENGLFQCSECTEKFPSRESYIAHYKRHIFLKQINAKCVVCGEYFFSKIFLAKHLRTTHKIDPKDAKIKIIKEENGSFSCSACKAVFTNRPSCNVHIRHQHVSNFRCDTCGTFWQCEASLRKHEKKTRKDACK